MNIATFTNKFRWGAAALGFAVTVSLTACGSTPTAMPSTSLSTTTNASTTASSAEVAPPLVDQLEVAEQPWWQTAPSPPPSAPPGTNAPPQTIPPPQTITVVIPGDVLFQPDRPDLTTGAVTQLAALQQRYLTPDPKATITVVGHTDIGTGAGTETVSKSLSTARAAAVRDWLIAHGVPATNITISGVGDTEPLFPSDSPAHRAANRRCDISVTTTAR